MHRLLLAALLLAITVVPATAEAGDPGRSDWWLDACENDRTICAGYIYGFHNALDYANAMEQTYWQDHQPEVLDDHKRAWNFIAFTIGRQVNCTAKVQLKQRIEVWLKHLREHPQEGHLPPAATFAKSQNAAFKCEKPQ